MGSNVLTQLGSTIITSITITIFYYYYYCIVIRIPQLMNIIISVKGVTGGFRGGGGGVRVSVVSWYDFHYHHL